MMIKLTSESKGVSLTFLGGDEIARMYGYAYTIHSADKYKELTNNLIFEYHSPEGFYSNVTPENYATQAIATNGSRWRGNILKAKTISFMFYPQLMKVKGALASPQTILNSILEADEEVRVDVYTDRIFTGYYYVEESSNSESGLISLTTSRNGIGVYWKVPNGIDIESYYMAAGTPYIIKTLPQTLLNAKNNVFPISVQAFALVDTAPVITLSHSHGEGGDWQNLVVTNALGEQQFTYNNVLNDKAVIVDCENKTVKNEYGEDRSADFIGSFIILKAGINNIGWQVDEHEYLPQDLKFTIKADGFTSTIE